MLGLGLGINKNNIASLASIPNRVEAILWALSKTIFGDPEVFLKDAIGRTTFDAVRGGYAVGDGATYFELDTEINLGTEHTIEFEASHPNVSSAIFA